MAFDIQTLVEASRCAECASPNQKQNVLLYLLNGILENGGSGGTVLHNLLSLTHPDTVPGPPLRGSLVVGNATPDWEALLIGAASRVLRSDGVDATWSQLVLTTDVTGILPIANGGTNSSAALNSNRIIVSSGGALVEAAVLTNGQLLIGSTGAAPVAASLTAGTNITITPGAGSISIAATIPGGFTGFDNPTALVGLAAVNGVATTAMRSDAAPALDQGIVPTWTGAHTWNPADNTTPITVTGYGLTGANAQSLLDLSGTWNTTGSPTAILLNIASTAAGSASLLMDIQRDSLTRFKISRTGFGTFTRQEADVSAGGIALNKRGTTGDPTAAIANTSSIAGIEINGWDGTAFGVGANIRAIATETWTAAGHGTSLVFSIAAIGSITTPIRFTLTSTAFAFSPHGVAAGNTSELRFLELAAGGVNYTGFKAADAMAASEIYVLPDAAPAANRFLRAGAVAAGVSTLTWAQVSLTADVTGILPVANGGSGTSTAFTQGSVIFAGPAGVFAQDNANFFWDDTNNRLGIGTVAPAVAIDVYGNGLRNVTTTPQLILENSTLDAGYLRFTNGLGINYIQSGLTATSGSVADILFTGTFATPTHMAIKSTGNVGIGTTSPGAKLQVNTAAATVCSIFRAAAAQSANITEWQNSSAGILVCVDEAGRVGIGVSNPVYKFEIQADNTIADGFKVTNSTNGASAQIQNRLVNDSNAVAYYGITSSGYTMAPVLSNKAFYGSYLVDTVIWTETANAIIFVTDGASSSYSVLNERMRITSAGRIGIGLTGPTSLLHIKAGTTAASTAPLKFTTGTSMTTAEAGAMEFTTDDLFFTITTGAARKRLLMADATAGLTSGKIPVATTNGRLTDLTASAAYTPTNVTTDRAYDANATSVDELADIVGTMIADLQTKGILG